MAEARPTAAALRKALAAIADPKVIAKVASYYQGGTVGSRVMGVDFGKNFAVAKTFVAMPLEDVERLLDDVHYEVRMAAMAILDFKAQARGVTDAERKALFDLYVRRHDRIDNWDLVDRAAPRVVGGWLVGRQQGAADEAGEVTQSVGAANSDCRDPCVHSAGRDRRNVPDCRTAGGRCASLRADGGGVVGARSGEAGSAEAGGFPDAACGRVVSKDDAGCVEVAAGEGAGGIGRAVKTMMDSWVFWALLSAVFAAMTAILGKVGVSGVDPDFATLIRVVVILGVAIVLVTARGVAQPLNQLPSNTLVFLGLSGLATGASWLCYYRALSLGQAAQVAPVDKLSIVMVAVLGVAFLGEALSFRNWLGIAMIGGGAVLASLKG